MYKRGTALLTTSTKPHNIRANLEISALPEDATREIWAAIKINIRFTSMIGTGLPGLLRGVIADLVLRAHGPTNRASSFLHSTISLYLIVSHHQSMADGGRSIRSLITLKKTTSFGRLRVVIILSLCGGV
jgi:hypothetical protein